ncbi:MAG TPA: hypothetical protein DER09_11455 [Prolixibacteraceae bacterium]|nr:hypothetical protein [Prolixibacteraceae bacterium]
MIIFILAAGTLAAQGDHVIYEGTHLNYRVGFNEGNTYAWEILSNVNPPEIANPGDAGFITDPNLSDVAVQWNLAGTYFVTVTETDAGGCSNKKALAVQVQPNNRSIGFGLTASTECFSISGNDFQLALSLLDNNGAPLTAAYFPLAVQFTVNGEPQSQLLRYNDQTLQITETMFTANPQQNTSVEVMITNVTDVKNVPVQPGANGTHLRTIYAIPEIEFTEELRRQYYDKERITAYSSFVSRTHRVEPK